MKFIERCSSRGRPNPSHGYTYLVWTNQHQQKTAQHHHQSHICKEQPSKVPKDVVERLSHATNRTIRNAEVIAPRYTIKSTLPCSMLAAHGSKPRDPLHSLVQIIFAHRRLVLCWGTHTGVSSIRAACELLSTMSQCPQDRNGPTRAHAEKRPSGVIVIVLGVSILSCGNCLPRPNQGPSSTCP